MGRGEEVEGRGGEWGRIKLSHVGLQILYAECDHYIYLKCTRKITRKRNEYISEPSVKTLNQHAALKREEETAPSESLREPQ